MSFVNLPVGHRPSLQLIGGVMCEVSLPHVGDFRTEEEARQWIVDNPMCRNKGDDLEYRILPVEGYYPEYTTMPLLYYTDRKKWEEQQKG